MDLPRNASHVSMPPSGKMNWSFGCIQQGEPVFRGTATTFFSSETSSSHPTLENVHINMTEKDKNLLTFQRQARLYFVSIRYTHQLIDSHMHLNKLVMQDRLPDLLSLEWPGDSSDGTRFQVTTMIANFVFPSRWKDTFVQSTWKKVGKFKFSLGLHLSVTTLNSKADLTGMMAELHERVEKEVDIAWWL